MPLSLVAVGDIFLANNLNKVVNVLQRSTGQSELGHYIDLDNAYASSATVGTYYSTLSRGVTPASMSVDASIVALTSVNFISTGHMDAFGIQIYGTSTAIALLAGMAGAIIVNY